MVVLKRESPTSLLVINPHLQNVKKKAGPGSIIANKNTVCECMTTLVAFAAAHTILPTDAEPGTCVCVCVCVCARARARVRACVRALADGTNCVLENLRAGDAVHFFGCPRCLSSNGPGKNANCTTEDFVPPPLGTQAYVVAGSPEEMTDETLLADAAGLASNLTAEYSFTPFDASDIWRVRFVQPLPATVGRASLVNIDSFSTPGTGESTALPLSRSFSQTNLKSPCAEQSLETTVLATRSTTLVRQPGCFSPPADRIQCSVISCLQVVSRAAAGR